MAIYHLGQHFVFPGQSLITFKYDLFEMDGIFNTVLNTGYILMVKGYCSNICVTMVDIDYQNLRVIKSLYLLAIIHIFLRKILANTITSR